MFSQHLTNSRNSVRPFTNSLNLSVAWLWTEHGIHGEVNGLIFCWLATRRQNWLPAPSMKSKSVGIIALSPSSEPFAETQLQKINSLSNISTLVFLLQSPFSLQFRFFSRWFFILECLLFMAVSPSTSLLSPSWLCRIVLVVKSKPLSLSFLFKPVVMDR